MCAAALVFGSGPVFGQIDPIVEVPRAPDAQRAKPANSALERRADKSGAAAPSVDSCNEIIVKIINALPVGGSYRTNSAALNALRRAAATTLSGGIIDSSEIDPSFCSSATYLVFLSALMRQREDGRLQLDDSILAALSVGQAQADGAGVWGRWNANGPGTARLFFEAGLGRNFTSIDKARTGDFLKIFWNDHIGAREFGHSVIYLGTGKIGADEVIRYWSSNRPKGFGTAAIPMKRVHRMLFSRLENPAAVKNLPGLPPRDTYLASLLKRASSEAEMLQMVGITVDPTIASRLHEAGPVPKN